MDKSLIRKTNNPCLIGELIREAVFAGSFGCYSCFEVKAQFRELTAADATYRRLLGHLVEMDDFEPEEDGTPTCYSDGVTSVMWYWDGDGTLLAETVFPDGHAMCVINTDCKKDHGWRWVKGAPSEAVAEQGDGSGSASEESYSVVWGANGPSIEQYLCSNYACLDQMACTRCCAGMTWEEAKQDVIDYYLGLIEDWKEKKPEDYFTYPSQS